MRKREWKDRKSQSIRKFAGRLCFLVRSEAILVKSHQHDCPRMNKHDTNGYAKVGREEPRKLQPHIKNYRQLGKIVNRRVSNSQP